MLGSRRARAWRGLAAAGVATFVAAVSHSAADGHVAPWLGIALAFAVAAPTCVILAGIRLSWMRLSVAVAISQVAFHALMLVGVGENLGGEGAASRLSDMASMPGMAGHPSTVALVESPVAAAVGHTDGWMWVAHACAAVVTVVALGFGERAVRALLRIAGWDLLLRLLAWRPAAVAERLPAIAVRRDAVPAAFIASVVRRRGPPLAA